jgi:hypothetical protein
MSESDDAILYDAQIRSVTVRALVTSQPLATKLSSSDRLRRFDGFRLALHCLYCREAPAKALSAFVALWRGS